MCFVITVSAPRKAQGQFEKAVRVAADRGLTVHVGGTWPWSRTVSAAISENGGCACSMLADAGNSPEDTTWTLLPEMRTRLGATMEALLAEGPSELAFQALWAGDSPAETRTLTPEAFLAEVAADRLGTRTRYVIRR